MVGIIPILLLFLCLATLVMSTTVDLSFRGSISCRITGPTIFYPNVGVNVQIEDGTQDVFKKPSDEDARYYVRGAFTNSQRGNDTLVKVYLYINNEDFCNMEVIKDKEVCTSKLYSYNGTQYAGFEYKLHPKTVPIPFSIDDDGRTTTVHFDLCDERGWKRRNY